MLVALSLGRSQRSRGKILQRRISPCLQEQLDAFEPPPHHYLDQGHATYSIALIRIAPILAEHRTNLPTLVVLAVANEVKRSESKDVSCIWRSAGLKQSTCDCNVLRGSTTDAPSALRPCDAAEQR